MIESNEYLYRITAVRPGFRVEMTSEEEAIMGEHFLYLKDLLDKGQLILAGPCLDREFGICVFRADSPEAAREIMNNDPAIAKGVMNGDLHPYRVSLLEGR